MRNKIEMKADDDALVCLSKTPAADHRRIIHLDGGDVTQQVSALLFRWQHNPAIWSQYFHIIGRPHITLYRTGDQ